MKFEIGKIYNFNYAPKGEVKEKTDPVIVRMNDELREGLVKYLQENAESIVTKYESDQEEHKDYYAMIKESERLASVRVPHSRKTAQEKDLEGAIKSYKEIHFPKRDSSETPEYRKAQNLFIRNYDPELMEMDGKIEAIFAGEYLTTKGNVAYKWYVLGATVEKSRVEGLESYLIEVID